MPEAYAHIRIARGAVNLSRIKPECNNAYEIGANGPDPIMCGGIFPHKSKVNMQKLSGTLHTKNCGKFLCALLNGAKTPAQRSYAMGFLMHYATDTIMHPYVGALTQKGAQYDMPSGHAFCESSMDSFFHLQDKGTKNVTVESTAPKLTSTELAEICVLFKASLKYVYNIDISITELADAFNTFRLGHKVNVSPFGGKKFIAKILDTLLKTNGALEGHMSPGALPKNGFAKQWVNPYTQEQINAGPNVLSMRAINKGSEYLKAAVLFWKKEITANKILSIIGNNDYVTGLPCE